MDSFKSGDSILNPPTRTEISDGHSRIKPFVHRTAIHTSTYVNNLADCKIFFKCENFQKVGAFKFRGATNAILTLGEKERSGGVATHSSGNHGQALALAAKTMEQFVERALRLNQQERGRPDGPSRFGAYVWRWGRWAVAGLC